MIKIIITTVLVVSSYAYPFEEENKIGPPIENTVLPEVPEINPITLETAPSHSEIPEDPAQEIPEPEGNQPENAKPEETDLKADATFWPWPIYRSYYSYYPHYSYRTRYYRPRYYSTRYYRPRVYYRHYYW